MRENRHLSRWRLIHYLRVFDRESETLLGHVVDITVGGMMLVSVDPIAVDRDYEVRMVLPGGSQPLHEERCLLNAVQPEQDAHPELQLDGIVGLTGYRADRFQRSGNPESQCVDLAGRSPTFQLGMDGVTTLHLHRAERFEYPNPHRHGGEVLLQALAIQIEPGLAFQDADLGTAPFAAACCAGKYLGHQLLSTFAILNSSGCGF